jgi:hypothetical protein
MADAGEDKVKVRFLADAVYETEGRNQGRKFVAGRVYVLSQDLAQRWIRRNVAELAEDAAEAEEDETAKPRRGRPPKAKAEDADEDAGGEPDEPLEPPPKQPEPEPKTYQPRSPYKAK